MSLITADGAAGQAGGAGHAGQGYQAIPLPRAPGDEAVLVATMVRQACGRRTRRAVLYVHCLGDPFVQPELAAWYLQRGFHFYVADLRAAGPPARDATLAEYFGYLDAAARQMRDADGNETILVSAHLAGAVIVALWCHSRRGRSPAEALILANPDFGPDQHWLARLLAGRQAARSPAGPDPRPADVLPYAQRRLRRGLDISCPVLVMSPPLAPGRAARPPRLGPHVTWLRLPGVLPGERRPGQYPPGQYRAGQYWAGQYRAGQYRAGQYRLNGACASPAGRNRASAERRGFYDELSRWLGAYLSAQIRDQLL